MCMTEMHCRWASWEHFKKHGKIFVQSFTVPFGEDVTVYPIDYNN